MTKKIFRGIILVSFAAILACFVFIMSVLYGHFETQFQHELENEAQLAAWGYDAAGTRYFSAGHSLTEFQDQSHLSTFMAQAVRSATEASRSSL